MKTNSSASKTINLTEERKDVRIYATDEETLNIETALKIEFKDSNGIRRLRFKLPEESLDKYRVELLKIGDK